MDHKKYNNKSRMKPGLALCLPKLNIRVPSNGDFIFSFCPQRLVRRIC